MTGTNRLTRGGRSLLVYALLVIYDGCNILRPVAAFTVGNLKSVNYQLKASSGRGDEEDEFVYVRRRKGRREVDKYDDPYDSPETTSQDSPQGGPDWLNDIFEDDTIDADQEDYEEESDDLKFQNVVIPNPLLDSIDPYGAGERFPETASDPRFWFDLIVVIVVVNWLASIGSNDVNVFI